MYVIKCIIIIIHMLITTDEPLSFQFSSVGCEWCEKVKFLVIFNSKKNTLAIFKKILVVFTLTVKDFKGLLP